jgi:methyl-accepting chemotaxis protein
MNWFNNLKIDRKIIMGNLLVVLLMIFLGVSAIKKMSDTNDFSNEINTNWLPSVMYISDMVPNLMMSRAAVLQHVLSTSDADMKRYETMYSTNMDNLKAKYDSYKKLISSQEEQQLSDTFQEELSSYMKESDAVFNLSRQNRNEEAKQLSRQKAFEVYSAALETMGKIKQLNNNGANAAAAGGAEAYSSGENLIIILLVFISIFSIAFGLYLARKISKPIIVISERVEQLKGLCVTNLKAGLDELSHGNLDYIVKTGTPLLEYKTKDEIGVLSGSVNNIITFIVDSVKSFDVTRLTVKKLVVKFNELNISAKEGNLTERGNEAEFDGGYKALIAGFNKTLDSVVQPISEAGGVLAQMADGNLTAKMTGNYEGDFLKFKNDINLLGESLNSAISDVQESVQTTASAASEISSSTEQMAAGAEELSNQNSEIATTIDEITKTIFENSKNTSIAAEASARASESANKGKDKILETKEGISKIVTSVEGIAKTVTSLAKKSEDIGEITSVIDDIADQTNLLALNAAIEAARAGDQGRGFAVVADEVRKLAERTTKATKEIADNINEIQKEAREADNSMDNARNIVNEGMKLTEEVSDYLQEIFTGVNRVSDLITQVAAASEQQSASAEEITKNIEAMTSVSHESTVGIQQVARATEDLNRLTVNLQELISKFRISQKFKTGSYYNGNLVNA